MDSQIRIAVIMQQLITQLGIDWHLLLSQAVNFAVLLVVLRIFAYKPLLKIMRERRQKIEEGLQKSEEATRRLHEVDEIAKQKTRATEEEAISIIRKTELQAKQAETKLLEEARRKESAIIESARLAAEKKEGEAREAFNREAASFVKAAVVKTVELSPEAIDEALVEKALREVRKIS